MNVLVSTDSSCLTSNDVFSGYDISVFPLNVIIDGEEFLDGVTINQETLEKEMRAGKSIKTSTPPLGSVIEYFEKLFEKGYDHVIHFTISSKLSSMYDLFCNVAKQHFDGKVTVVDSYALSSVMLSYVFYAFDAVKEGVLPEKIKEVVESQKENSDVFFIPENLTALKNGGRISPAAALIGNIIGIKPIIVLKDGALEKEGTTKKMRKEFVERATLLKEKFSTDSYDYSVMHFGVSPEKMQQMFEALNAVLPDCKIVDAIIPINCCAHCGPGTVGLLVSPKMNGKSLNEF